MKTILLLNILFFFNFAKGQIITPTVKANFGIDGEVRSNFFNGMAQPAYDDWYTYSNVGTGQFVIDTTGAAAIVAGYISNPVTRQLSFSRIMKQYPYTTVNNRLLIDAIFHRDFHGSDSTVFASGSNKNGMTPANWSCPVAQGIPDKNDILDAFTHVRRAGPNVSDSMWMFSGISIENTNGSRYFDFELYQSDISYDRVTQTFRNYGPDAGHTSWQFDASGNATAAGDIIFTAEFGSSSLSLIEARVWINRSALAITPASFSWGGQFDGDGSGASFGYASIRPKTAGAFYSGLPCVNNTWAGPFSLIREDNSMVTNYVANQFLEFSVNLTKLGLDPGQTIHNPCGTPFRRVLIKSRASTSFTSELKDFIAPFRMFDFPLVNANTFIIYYCELFPPTTIAVQNPYPASVYTWSTTNGHIVGSNVGSSIVVDAAGTYYVSQQLHVQCGPYSTDSITMFFDPVCTLLDIDFLDLAARKINTDAELKWKTINNQDIANFKIEYSFDNNHFISIPVTIPANNMEGIASYSFKYPFAIFTANELYYKIKAVGKNGKMKYSNTVVLSNTGLNNSNASIYPNPTKGDLWFSFDGSIKETANLTIWDSNGKMIDHSKININKGENVIRIPALFGKSKGIYLVKVRSVHLNITKKLLLN